MSWRHRICAIFFVTIATCWSTAGEAAQGRLENVSVSPQPFLGLAFPGNNVKNYRAMSRAGIGVARLVVTWQLREPKPGSYSWKAMDQRIIGLQKLGIEPFLTFESKSDWGVRKETQHLTNGTPKDMAQWTRFVGSAVERYDGDGNGDAPGLLRPVNMYQVANEWEGRKNPWGGWGGTTPELINFVNKTFAAIKKQHPGAIVVLGGMTSPKITALAAHMGMNDLEIKKRQSGPGSPIVDIPPEKYRRPEVAHIVEKDVKPVLLNTNYDYMDLHLYGPANNDPARISAVRNIVGDRKILSAECGGPSMNFNMRYLPEDHFMAVVRRNLIVLSSGLKFCLWLGLGPRGSGTFENGQTSLFDENKRPKPGYGGYILLAAVLQDMERIERRGDQHVFVVHRKGKPPLMIGWAEDGAKNMTVKLPSNATGNMLTIKDPVRGTYEISGLPASKTLKLGKWPVVVGQLPDNLMQ